MMDSEKKALHGLNVVVTRFGNKRGKEENKYKIRRQKGKVIISLLA